MHIAYLSPLPPVRSGIANYSAMLLPALARLVRVTAVGGAPSTLEPTGFEIISMDEYRERRSSFDAVVYQMGNNPHHEAIYLEAMQVPGTVVLHEIVLHHLLVEMTLARGDAEAYIGIMRDNHGAAGEAWARGRAAGIHTELANFLFPASRIVAERSRSVIVQNAYAARRLESLGVTSPVIVIPHPLERTTPVSPDLAAEVRRRLGLSPEDRVIGMFGFVTSSKRPEVVFEAFARASREDPRLRLLVVGEPAPNLDLQALADRFGIARDRWQSTGYVADDDFELYLAAVDRVVSLRYPSGGETSGALLRIFAAGKVVAVNDYAQFSDLPAETVWKIPFQEEVEHLTAFIRTEGGEDWVRDAQLRWLEQNADVTRTAEAYVRAIRAAPERRTPAAPLGRSMPLFPVLSAEVEQPTVREGIVTGAIRLRNQGDETIRTAVYGEPGYRLIVKALHGDREVADRWLSLPTDLAPGEECRVPFSLDASEGDIDRLEAFHAIEGGTAARTPLCALEIA